MGFLDPITAVVVAFCLLGIMLYKRINLGITLNATAMLLALLALSWQEIPTLVYTTSISLLTVSVVLATFGIMWLSQLYKETGYINKLSESLGKIIKNPKIVSTVLPAVIGFLPVAGGALMSAPLVEAEGEKLKLTNEKRAYVNLWFRHTIFPVYPISQVLIVTAALAGTTVIAIILRQIPAVIVMIIVGYLIGFWKTPNPKKDRSSGSHGGLNSNLKAFSIAFTPILATIIVAIGIELSGLQLQGSELSQLGFDVLIATFFGILVLVVLSRLNPQTFVKPLKSWGIYGVTFAAYGAFLLGNMMKAVGIPKILETLAASGSVDTTILLTLIPALLGVLTASALGGVSISIPLLGGIIALSSKTASLIYMSAYLGYVISPTHLCFAFTADYFKCPLNKAYKYILPSFAATFATTLLVYFLF